MKVLNLRCGQHHLFEGWFASEEEFLAQVEQGAIACPLCGDTAAVRLPSAPRLLNIARHSRPADAAAAQAAATPRPTQPAQMTLQSEWLRAVRHVMASTEDVGARFPEEARRIHYGEVEERGIRGCASAEDAAALREEGIEVMSLPVPDALKGTAQ